MKLQLIIIISLLELVFCTAPPLASLPKSLLKERKEFLQSPSLYAFNLGLDGTVTQEHWDRATIFDDNPPTIEHPDLNGSNEPVTVIGKKMMSIKNRTINAFQGIRFAKPPIKEMRFKKPVPEGVYFANKTLVANHLGEKCPQRALFGPIASGSEDCLNLNVYTPYVSLELTRQ
ncbi:Carboxylesterase 5A [Halocaridina rubra]|uniref:Carboxylesterase 5A n=1 Tax=Halocaridina rubra TaxID=373956 RepID=A0AAN9ACG4_HALRR